MNRTGYLENKIAGYVLFAENPDGTTPETLKPTDLDRTAALQLTPRDLLLSSEDIQHFRDTGFVHLYRVLSKFCNEEMLLSRQYITPPATENSTTRMRTLVHPPPTIPAIKVLNDRKPSSLFTLPVLSLDETKVEELMQALAMMIEELGQNEAGLDMMIALVSGDWLTIRNIVLGLYQLQDGENVKERLDFLEPVIGLFHLQMNVLKIHMQNFWQPMLEDFAGMIRDKKVSFKVPDFRAANYFFNDVLDGALLAAFCQHKSVDVADAEELKAFLERSAKIRLDRERAKFKAERKQGKSHSKGGKTGNNADVDGDITMERDQANEGNHHHEPTGKTTLESEGVAADSQPEEHPDDFDWTKVAKDIMDELYDFRKLHKMRTDEETVSEEGNDTGMGMEADDLEAAPETMSTVRKRQRKTAREDNEYESINVPWPGPDSENERPDPTSTQQSNHPQPEERNETQKTTNKRDLLYENYLLFAREALVYREYEDAVSCGDVGRIEKVVRYWAVMYQGTKLTNYPQEMIHLVACLLKIWGGDIREMWLNNCLVNMVGRKGAWLPLNLFCE